MPVSNEQMGIDTEYEKHLQTLTDVLRFLAPVWYRGYGGDLLPPEALSEDELRLAFREKVNQARVKYGNTRLECLASHLRRDFKIMTNEDFDGLFDTQPHIIYRQMWAGAQKGITGGSCPECSGIAPK